MRLRRCLRAGRDRRRSAENPRMIQLSGCTDEARRFAHALFGFIDHPPQGPEEETCSNDGRKTPHPLQGAAGTGGGLVLAASLLARFGATLAQLGDQDDDRLQVQLPMAAIGAAPVAGTKALRVSESLQELP